MLKDNMTTAPLTSIKRFAVHDGPGIRTTLFLKGCPLRCIWCHNPETQRPSPELCIHYAKCRGCGECAKVCGCHVIENGRHEFNRAECHSCGRCADACLFDALELFGRETTVAEAAERLLEDRIFYADGGGITLSGGEPLLHPDFCAEVLAIMKAEGIHSAVDTCGHVRWNAFEAVLPYADMFLYDFKCADSERHRQLTGAGNETIIDNLIRLGDTGKTVEIRMVMVPNHNMDKPNLQKAADILRAVKGISAIRLLPYHSMARSKYASIDHADTMPNVDSPTTDELEHAAAILRNSGHRIIL